MASKHWTALIVLMLFVSIQVLKTSGELRDCISSEDCDEDECCASDLSKFRFDDPTHVARSCKKLRNLGERCYLGAEALEQNGILPGLCPCANGLKCEIIKVKRGWLDLGPLPEPECVKE